MWFDSHCHVTADAFSSDRAEVLDRASEAGVEGFVAIGSGYGIPHNARPSSLATTNPMSSSAGVPPGLEGDQRTDIDSRPASPASVTMPSWSTSRSRCAPAIE